MAFFGIKIPFLINDFQMISYKKLTWKIKYLTRRIQQTKSYKFEFSEIFNYQNTFFAYFWFIFIAFFFKNKMVQTNSQKFRIPNFGIGCWIRWAQVTYLVDFLLTNRLLNAHSFMFDALQSYERWDGPSSAVRALHQ